MILSQAKIGSTYKIIALPPNNPCMNCMPCIRLRKMELGIIPGELIRIENHSLGIWIISFLNGSSSQIAMRNDEVENIEIEEIFL